MRREIDPKTRKRLRQNNFGSLLFWALTIVLIFARAPFWAVLLVSIAGAYFAVRDWRTERALAQEHFTMHSDPDVQTLIDGEIDISEYRQRKEKQT
jgi:hypothetical protein